MRNIPIDFAQAMATFNAIYKDLSEECYRENSNIFNSKIRSKIFYPDYACGRSCVRIGDFVDAFMSLPLSDLKLCELGKIMEDLGKYMSLAIGVTNWDRLNSTIAECSEKSKDSPEENENMLNEGA